MIEVIQKRPFIRPLVCWIAGVVMQVCYPLQQLSWLLLIPLMLSILGSSVPMKKPPQLSYETRWVWGAVFVCLFLFLSIQSTYLAELRMTHATAPSWVAQRGVGLQQLLVHRMERLRLTDEERSVLTTITVNYRQEMTWALRQQFSVIGVAHLLSVSGFHVAIICGVLVLFFRLLPKFPLIRWLKTVTIILLLWLFSAISGFSLPSVRAVVMLSIFMLGQALDRRTDGFNSLMAAAFLILLFRPFDLFDVGFQLSFSAVFFILFFQPRFAQLVVLRNPLLSVPWNVLSVTLAAQLGTVALCCYYFGQFSLLFLLTNLLLSLLAMVLIPLTLLWVLLPAATPGIMALQSVVEWLMRLLMWFVQRFSQLSWATFSLRFDLFTLLASYVVLGFFCCFVVKKRLWMLNASAATLLLILLRWLLF